MSSNRVTDIVQPVALVTGAGRQRGIGRACALRLASDGYAVVVHARALESLANDGDSSRDQWRNASSVVKEIRDAGGTAQCVVGDLRSSSTIDEIKSMIVSCGDLATIVNNAATSGEANAYAVHETPEDLWRETFDINVTTLFTLTSALIPLLTLSRVENKSIVNLSSTAGKRPLQKYGAYCASKAAVEAMTIQQAIELAKIGVRVNCVAPGSTSTDMIDHTLERAAQLAGLEQEQILKLTMKKIPMRRFAEPAEIAAVVSFLVGKDSSFITGQVITVDGGMTLL